MHRKGQFNSSCFSVAYFVVSVYYDCVIGYGDLTPKSSNSKLFFICYAIVGIPMMLWYLSMCGQVQNDIYAYILKSIRTSIWHKNDRSYKNVGPFMISLFVLVIFWFIGAVLLHKTTDTTLLDSLYYWFVTFTTNGFGDILISTKVKASIFYLWMIYKWFMLNLVFGLIQSTLVWISGFNEAKQSMCCMCWHSADHDSDEADTIARYNLELAKQQEFIQLHRQHHY